MAPNDALRNVVWYRCLQTYDGEHHDVIVIFADYVLRFARRYSGEYL